MGEILVVTSVYARPFIRTDWRRGQPIGMVLLGNHHGSWQEIVSFEKEF